MIYNARKKQVDRVKVFQPDSDWTSPTYDLSEVLDDLLNEGFMFSRVDGGSIKFWWAVNNDYVFIDHNDRVLLDEEGNQYIIRAELVDLFFESDSWE